MERGWGKNVIQFWWHLWQQSVRTSSKQTGQQLHMHYGSIWGSKVQGHLVSKQGKHTHE